MSEKFNLPLIGGLLAGIASSLCCAGPLILLSLGVSGAWISNLTALEPYRPLFIAIALIALVMAYLAIHQSVSDQSCEEGKLCAEPALQRWYKNIFWGVVAVVIIAIASPYWISFMYR